MGTALNKILKELVVKSRSMAGFDAPYVVGYDCHGLPIELRVDRELGAKARHVGGRFLPGLPGMPSVTSAR
jgi:isoleucyl-tRNA synthetase